MKLSDPLEHSTPGQDAGQQPQTPPSQWLGWAAMRIGLAVFAIGWILTQAASALLLLLEHFGPQLDPVLVQVAKLLFNVIYRAGIIYFLTGMLMGCAVPVGPAAKRLGWAMVGCLALSGTCGGLLYAADFQNQEVLAEIVQEIQARQQKKEGPPRKEDLERELDRQWSPGILRAVLITFIGAFGLGKLLFTGLLWTVARHFKQQVLASGLVIYLLAEVFGMAVAVSIVVGQPGRLDTSAGFGVFTGNWYSVAAASGFCAWFLVYVYQVRRIITQALLRPLA